MHFKIVKLITFFYLCFNVVFFAQKNTVQFKHYSIEDGLSEVNARCIIQDKYGFLWIGTQDGLNRYDGYKFKIFKHNPKDSNSIAGNFINCLLEDSKGIIWIGTERGLSSFDASTGKFTRYNINGKVSRKRLSDNIRSLYEDSDSVLWIGVVNGYVIKFDINQNKKLEEAIKDPENLFRFGKRGVIKIVEDKKNNLLWFALMRDGIFSFNRLTGEINRLPFSREKENCGSNVVFSINCDSEGNLLIGTLRGMCVFNVRKKIFQKELTIYEDAATKNVSLEIFNNIHVNVIYSDKEEKLWVGTLLEGLFYLDNKSGKFINYKNNVLNPSSISNNNIFSIYEDKNKLIWIGTGKGGVNKFDKKEKYFFNITNLTHGISNNSIGSVLEDRKGNLWVGTDGGLNRIDLRTGKVTVFLHEPGNKYSLSNNKVYSLTEDKEGNIWAGTHYGLNKYIPEENRFIRYLHNPSDDKGIQSNFIRYLFCDDEGIIWMCAVGGGLIKFSPKENKFENYVWDPNNPNSIGDNRAMYVTKDEKGFIWVCAGASLNKFNPETEKFEHIFEDKRINKGNYFFFSYKEKNGVIWIGTANGLIRFAPEENDTTIFTENDGLLSDNIYAIFPDSSGNLWLSAQNGITKYDQKTGKFINYNTKDGIACREFNTCAFYKNKSGRIYFGSVDGLTYFYPDRIKKRTQIPKVVISKFSVFDKPLVKNKVYFSGEEIYLDYSQNFISMEFAALDFTEQYINKYAYRLEGIDKDWIYSGDRRYASYTNLEPGRYVFKVKAFDNEFSEDENYTSLIINIIPLFWQTWQFKIIPPLLLALIIGIIVFIKIRSMLEMERLRVKIASDLHDDVGASLSKISMTAGLLAYESDKNKIKKSADKLISISQEVISTMGDVVWSIDARNDRAADLIDRMKSFMLSQTEDKRIEVNFKTYCNTPDKKIPINTRQNIYLIFKEALNNAVKYSNSEEFDLEITMQKNRFGFILADNGRGLPQEIKRKGNGLKNMKMRAEKIGGKIKFLNEKGLTISFSVKI